METGLIIQAIIALLDFLEPRLGALREKGEISQDDQLKLKARIDKFRSGEAFKGPEWQTGDANPATTLTMPSSGGKQVHPEGAPQGTNPSNMASGEGGQIVGEAGHTPPPAPAIPAPGAPTARPKDSKEK